MEIPLQELSGEDGGHYRISRLSRPILKVRIPMGDQTITVFNCHLKSKLGEFIRPEGADFAPEADITNYNAHGRALGSLRAGLRRMAEAWVLRGFILDEIAEERDGKVTIAKINIDDNPNTPGRYGVRGIPTLMLFNDGNVQGTKVGAANKSKLIEFINEHID